MQAEFFRPITGNMSGHRRSHRADRDRRYRGSSGASVADKAGTRRRGTLARQHAMAPGSGNGCRQLRQLLVYAAARSSRAEVLPQPPTGVAAPRRARASPGRGGRCCRVRRVISPRRENRYGASRPPSAPRGARSHLELVFFRKRLRNAFTELATPGVDVASWCRGRRPTQPVRLAADHYQSSWGGSAVLRVPAYDVHAKVVVVDGPSGRGGSPT